MMLGCLVMNDEGSNFTKIEEITRNSRKLLSTTIFSPVKALGMADMSLRLWERIGTP